MKDRAVRFTGVTLLASDILGSYGGRKTQGPFKPEWERVEIPITVTLYGVDFVGRMDAYLAEKFESKWGAYLNDENNTLVVFFEDGNDAIMFKLMDGATAYLNQSEE
jgi:hypothetical protein